MLQCVIFDFDQTLVDLKLDDKKILNEIIGVYLKGGLSRETLNKYQDPHVMIGQISESISSPNINNVQKAVYKKLAECEIRYIDRATIFPTSIKVLEKLKSRGKKIGIVSSNSINTVKKASEKFGILSFFDAVLGIEDPGRPKPHSDKILFCLKMLKCKAYESILVGDTIEDVSAGKNAGVYTIGVLTGSSNMEKLSSRSNIE